MKRVNDEDIERERDLLGKLWHKLDLNKYFKVKSEYSNPLSHLNACYKKVLGFKIDSFNNNKNYRNLGLKSSNILFLLMNNLFAFKWNDSGEYEFENIKGKISDLFNRQKSDRRLLDSATHSLKKSAID